MTKIDETKQYKFSQIVRMLEDKELPVGTSLISEYCTKKYPYIVARHSCASPFNNIFEMDLNEPILTDKLFGYLWTIKLPEDDKYYLKAPKEFVDKYLNLNMNSGKYFLSDKSCGYKYQTQFTQSEISAMPFDTNFFGEPIKVENEK